MTRRRWLSFLLVPVCAAALCQTAASSPEFIAARQGEVDRLAKVFYQLNLNEPGWTHHQVAPCSAFTHHLFAEFDRDEPGGGTTRLLAIYSRNTPPAKSLDRPWEGGTQLIVLEPHHPEAHSVEYDESARVGGFNRILAEERKAGAPGGPSLGMNEYDMADCFVRFSGEVVHHETALDRIDPAQADPNPIDKTLHVETMMVVLEGPKELARTQYLVFDKQGLISLAHVQVRKAY